MRSQDFGEGVDLLIPESTGNSDPGLSASRQGVRLLLVLNLQTMLDRPQKNVSVMEQAHFIRRKDIQLLQRNQSFETVSLLQESISGSVQELQGLQDELDFPNASVSELHVTVELRRADNVSFDPSFDRCNFVQQIGRNDSWKNKRLQSLVELVEQFIVSSHTPRLD